MLFKSLRVRFRFFLPFVVSFLLCSCTRSSAQDGITRIWAVDDGEKVRQNDLNHWAATSSNNPVWDGSTVRLFASRNEIVGFQLILEASGSGANHVSVLLDTLFTDGDLITNTGGIGDPYDYVGKRIELFVTQYLYVPTRSSYSGSWGWGGARALPDDEYLGWIPDALVPFESPHGDRASGQGGAPFRILPGTSQSVWIDITVPRTQKPGMYVGTIVVTEAGFVTQRIPVFLRVYDATLPDETHVRNFFAYGAPLMEMHPGVQVGTGEYHAMLRKYMNMAHRHRMTLADGGRTVDEFSAWMGGYYSGEFYRPQYNYEGPGEGAGEKVYSIGTYDQPSHGFLSGFDPPTREQWQLASDRWETWFSQFAPATLRFKYMIDEPEFEEHPTIKERASWILSNPGPGKNLGIFCATRLHPDLVGSINVWGLTAQSGYVSPDGVSSGYDLPKVAERKAAGEIVGIYNGTRPSFGQASALDTRATDNRANPWIMWKYDVDFYFLFDVAGFCYTKVNSWADQRSVVHGSVLWGDGFWIYAGEDKFHPGESRGLRGPIASLRMKNWRRGVQDYEYLWVAKQTGIETAAIVDRVVPRAFNDYGDAFTSQSSQPLWGQRGFQFESARRELAALIASRGTPANLAPAAGLHASPAVLSPSGGEVTLTWMIEDADGGTLDNGLGSVGSIGSMKVTVTKTTSFVLSVNTPRGNVRATATVRVGPHTPSTGANLLRNPDFDDGVEGWTLESSGGAILGQSTPGYQSYAAARIVVSDAQNPIRLSQSGLKMYRYGTYRLKFAARSPFGLDLEAKLVSGSTPATSYGLPSQIFDLTPEWKEFVLDFVSENIADSVADASFIFDLSSFAVADGEYYFDNISLSKTGAVVPPSPQDYALEQNYPNPFNPLTTIEFALPSAAQATLKIFNMLGQEVATLVNEYLSEGIHRADFNAALLPSGLYAYRLQAGDFVSTRKMMLVK
jgi:hypothetical protein